MASILAANLAFAGTSHVPIIIHLPVIQPGNSCIPDGVATGEETKTSKGDNVVATGIHGAHATRCPDPRFPNLATTAKLPSDEARRLPSPHCVPQGAKVDDELMIPSYGRATVVEIDAGNDKCTNGVMANVVATTAYRASHELDKSSAATYEPTEADIQREYDRVLAARPPVKEYHVRHILLRTQADAVAALNQIYAGLSFAEIAAGASIDTGSKNKGGDLGWNLPSYFVDEFSKSMVSLAPSGLVTEPVKTRFGWHVIEVLETKVGKDSFPPFASVKARIAASLRSRNGAMNALARVPAKAVCRKMVAPVLPTSEGAARAKGTVIAEMRVENGRVADILKLSGPSELYGPVTDALNKYECDRLDQPAIAVQSFEF